MQAIRTRYLGPTNTRPARMAAQNAHNRITLPYEDGLGTDANHKLAMEALVAKAGWAPALMKGGEFQGDQYWVFVNS